MNTTRKLLQLTHCLTNGLTHGLTNSYIYGLKHNNLNNFIEKTIIMKDPNNKLVEYYENNDKIGYIYYNLQNGSINIFYINEKYRNQGLGKQILNKVINEMKDYNIDILWVTNASKYNEFWKNVNNKSFTYKFPIGVEPHLSGYYMKLK
jgi:GNAT superfamily N-acetyltransferase